MSGRRWWSAGVSVVVLTALVGCGSESDTPAGGDPATIVPKVISAVPETGEAAEDLPAPALGRASGGASVGLGDVEPSIVSLGSTCSSTITEVTWTSWGDDPVTGTGRQCEPAASASAPSSVTLVASDIGWCEGVRAYRKLTIDGNDVTICATAPK